ncbi:hypothetical protein Tco_0719160 [Tanacetum coccineum]
MKMWIVLRGEPTEYEVGKLARDFKGQDVISNSHGIFEATERQCTFVQLCLYYNFYSKYGTNALSKFSPDTELVLTLLQISSLEIRAWTYLLSNYPAYSLVSCLQGLLVVGDCMGLDESSATTH